MKKKAFLTYMEKDGPNSEDIVFYVDERVINVAEPKLSSELKPLHWHDYFELEIILNGSGKHHFNDTVYDLSAGSAYIVTPSDFHSVEFDGDESGRVIHIQFDTFTMTKEVTRLITNSPLSITTKFEGEDFEYIKILCSKLLEEFNSNHSDKVLMIRAVLEQICILTVRHSVSVNTQKTKARDDTILQVVNYLNYNFRSKVTLRSVADKFILNPNYLGEKFHKTLGTSFTSYVNDLRLSYAMRLLTNSELSIKQISEESGFASVSYFIKLFSEKYGDAPRRMRKTGKY